MNLTAGILTVTSERHCNITVPLTLPYWVCVLTSDKVFSKERTAHLLERWDLQIQSCVRAGHKETVSLQRGGTQFKPLGFIEPKVCFTYCFFLHIYIYAYRYANIYLLLHLETPLISEMQAFSHMRNEKENPTVECACKGKAWGYNYS